MKTCVFVAALVVLSSSAGAQPQRKSFPIWPGVAPGSESWTQKEIEFIEPQSKEVWLRNVVTPTLTAYRPEPAKDTGVAVIVVPGGGLSFSRWTNAVEIADWLASRGISAFVLKHRLKDTGTTDDDLKRYMNEHYKLMELIAGAANRGEPLPALDGKLVSMIEFGAEDVRQAVRSLRKDAKAWGVKSDRIGVMGLSSGGVLAMGAAVEHDAESRPDFISPIYAPWFTKTAQAPAKAAPSFIGAKVPSDAPPVFIVVASDDLITVSGSLLIYNTWRTAGRSAEMHVYAVGGHGFGVKPQGLPVDGWLERFADWLKLRGEVAR
ncbi:alpha/beta hydrolase [Paludisphaera borealis]|uniref:Alpha/beta hydrolase n=1 Tax=Paludisphaera borealis TaxID=1387353 RepID=A0A1U7CPY0_9BACT|nr:alpha/beta hydrolase [Paludisphaera borealis]APW60969.1 alpha/beta hydrolase [Paludisphaera borealis]